MDPVSNQIKYVGKTDNISGVLESHLSESKNKIKRIHFWIQGLLELGLTRDDMLETLVDTTFTGDEIKMDSKLKGNITREWKKRCPIVAEKVNETECNSETEEEENVEDVDWE
jgi:hypothetical protein